MKIKLKTYSIDLNEEIILRTRKTQYLNTMVRSLAWTGIDREILAEKLAEAYDLVKEKK